MLHGSIKSDGCISPPSQFYSRKPAIVLSYPKRQRGRDIETGQTHSEFDDMDDLLDRHVESVLTRRDKVKRTLRGVWSFLRTRQCNCTHVHSDICSLPFQQWA